MDFHQFLGGVDISSNIHSFLNNLHDKVVFQNLEHKIIWANEKVVKASGVTLSELVGKHCYQVKFNREQPCVNCPVVKAKETGNLQWDEYTTPDGNVLLLQAYPVKDNNGRVQGIIKISLDVSRRNKLEKKLKLNKMKNIFFSNLSHELKTPLNLIYSASQLLESRIEDSSHFNKYIDIIQNNYYRLLKIVNNLIDITKMESGYYKIQFKNHNIVEIVKRITQSAKDYIESEGKILKFNSTIEKEIIACDVFNMERILLNLLSNATKFTNPGDKIIVMVAEKAEDIVVSVKDTGIGIPRSKKKQIFQRFHQLNTDCKGSGLGLSIVKSLVDMHNGDIDLKSEYGRGSEFIIKLPRRKISEEGNQNKNNYIQYDIDRINLEFSEL